jgi:hypothetical protein
MARDGKYNCLESELNKRKPPEKLGSWEEVEKITHWHPEREAA